MQCLTLKINLGYYFQTKIEPNVMAQVIKLIDST